MKGNRRQTPQKIGDALTLAVGGDRQRRAYLSPRFPAPLAKAVKLVEGAEEVMGALSVLRAAGDTPERLLARGDALAEEAKRGTLPGTAPDAAEIHYLGQRVHNLWRLVAKADKAVEVLKREGFQVDGDGTVRFQPSGGGRPAHLFRRLVVELFEALPVPPGKRVGNRKADREAIAKLLAPYFPDDYLATGRGGAPIFEAIREHLRR